MYHTRLALCYASACALLFAASPVRGQADTTDVPVPPVAQLSRLEQFFGTYEHDNNFWQGVGPFRGTLDVGPAIKGWYVEWVINTRYGPIDRQLRMLTTWDDELDRYRVWRFETTPQARPGAVEAEAHFDGNEFVMEWKNARGPDGRPGVFRNRIRMEGPDQLVIISEAEPKGGELVELGVWRNTRVLDRPAERESRRSDHAPTGG